MGCTTSKTPYEEGLIKYPQNVRKAYLIAMFSDHGLVKIDENDYKDYREILNEYDIDYD